MRAKIVLLASEGLGNDRIAAQLGMPRQIASKWHQRFWTDHCRNHDPLRAGGEYRRCPERNVRADELDAFVFDQVRATMLHPEVLLTGEAAV